MQQKPSGTAFWDEAYDSKDSDRATRTLVICSAPRTGSSELCRLLTVAGVGVPHEYFNPFFSEQLASRWQIKGNPLDSDNIDEYLEALLTRRTRNGIFATKLQFWQYETALQNPAGSNFLKDAVLVHLYRADIVRQFRSLRIATISSNWGDHRSGVYVGSPKPNTLDSTLKALDFLIAEDAGLRRLFVVADKTPLFMTMDDVVDSPQHSVEKVAQAVGVSPDLTAVENAIALSKPYQKDPLIDKEAGETIEMLRQHWLLTGSVKRPKDPRAKDGKPGSDFKEPQQDIAKLHKENEKLQKDLKVRVDTMKNSMSWKITSPLRRAGRLLHWPGRKRSPR